MHVRRFAAFILGAWLAGSAFVALVALHNSQSAARIMSWPPPQAAKSLSILGAADARALLNYQAFELNGSSFEAWQWTQLALGAVLLLILVFAYRAPRSPLVICSIMLALAVIALCYVVPELRRLGRIVSFLPAGAQEVALFRRYNFAYAGIELARWLLGFVLATLLLRRSHHSPAPRRTASKPKWVRTS